MSRFTVSGLSSGLDWKTVVDEIIRLERAGVTRLEARRAVVDRQAQAWADIGSRLRELRSRTQAMARPESWGQHLAESSDPARVEAVARTGAVPGVHELTVLSLAAAHRVASGAHAGAGESLGLAGTFQVNGQTVTVENHHTLNDLAGRVAAAGVRTAVVRAGEEEHYLVLTAAQTGTANAIHLEEGPEGVLAALGLLDGQGQVNTLTAAADAVFRLNGLTLSRPGNTVADALPGVTLHLRGTGEDTVRVEVGPDHEAALAAAASFVTAYNAALRSIRSSAARGGDVLLAQLQERLAGLVTGRADGDLQLWQLGMATGADRSGDLVLDRGRLQSALLDDPQAVRELLTSKAEALGAYLAGVVRHGDGLVPARNRALSQRKTALDREIQRAEERLAARERTLTAQFLAMEKMVAGLAKQSSALAIPLTWLATGRREQ